MKKTTLRHETETESLLGEIARLRGAITNTQQKIWKNWGVEPQSLEILHWLDSVLAVDITKVDDSEAGK
jgi:hypothetical protein